MFILVALFLAIVMPIMLGGTMILAVWAHHSQEKAKLRMEQSKINNEIN